MIINSKFITHNSKYILVVLILLSAAALNHLFSKQDIELPRKSLSEFPKTLGDWTVLNEQTIDDKAMKILQVDDYIVRNYRNSKGEVLGIYVGYWKSQREGKGSHSPRQCLPGSGWFPIDISVYKISVKDHNPNSVPVNKFVMGKGLDRHLYLFWYQGRNRIYASEYWNRIYLVWDAITKKRTDGALVRIDNAVTRSPDDSLKTQVEFIQLISPILKEYIAN